MACSSSRPPFAPASTTSQKTVVHEMTGEYHFVKAYVHDNRAPADGQDEEASTSFLKNEVKWFSAETTKTMTSISDWRAKRAVVERVSRLRPASREKAFVFIVVNKWGGIRDKARCMRIVGEQIKLTSISDWRAKRAVVERVSRLRPGASMSEMSTRPFLRRSMSTRWSRCTTSRR
jgi:hypothetical protein